MNLVFSVYFVVAVAKSVPALLSPLTSEPNNLIYKCTCHNNFLYFFLLLCLWAPCVRTRLTLLQPFFLFHPPKLGLFCSDKVHIFCLPSFDPVLFNKVFGLFFAFHYGSHVNFFFISYSLFFRICSLTAKLAGYVQTFVQITPLNQL